MPLSKQIAKFVSNVEEWQAKYFAARTLEEKLGAAQGIRLWLHGVYREVDSRGLDQPPHERGKHREILESLERVIVGLDRSIQVIKLEKVNPTESFKVDCEKLREDLRMI